MPRDDGGQERQPAGPVLLWSGAALAAVVFAVVCLDGKAKAMARLTAW
ncbi:hypothetical protein [Carbonactinospora thermoautotrophica]|uniref:Uncharacterized protein n=1 Tax=Carbonactinospora thermoautotrophica TaxID=1469144 RepID=A0A132MMW6_9ACTN|nr:hypothetical protein [Carbonactinospora thermoautotrophica]KWW99202.1 hypothetical protein LI90_836 [Carbonactinospora thermoautotrophica]